MALLTISIHDISRYLPRWAIRYTIIKLLVVHTDFELTS